MTQKERVLELLRRHGDAGLTSLEALYLGCGMRLGARIYDLKADGHVIDTELVTIEGATVARYTLRQTPTAAAPMRGSQESWL